jgi:hypothetical protein
MGPIAPWMSRHGLRRRAERWVLQRPIAPVVEDLADYFYHNLCSDGAGEYVLRYVFAPGVYAYAPIGERFSAAAAAGRVSYPVTFCYGGSHDWMSAPAGDAACKQLRAHGLRAECHRIPNSGHHLYLENPAAFNATVLSELAATLEAEADAEPVVALVGSPAASTTGGSRSRSDESHAAPAAAEAAPAGDGVQAAAESGTGGAPEVALAPATHATTAAAH